MDEIRIYRKVTEFILPAIVCTGFFIGFLTFKEAGILMQILGCLLFGMTTIAALWQLFDRRPILTIDETGITRRFLTGSTFHVNWSDVDKFHSDALDSISFDIINESSLVDKMSRAKKFGIGYMKYDEDDYAVWTAFSLPMEDLTCDKNIHERIQKFVQTIKERE